MAQANVNVITNKDKSRLAVIKALLNAHDGKFFTVTALRKSPKKLADGTVEHFMTMTGRKGVKAHLKGGESTIAHKEDLISLYVVDKDREDYRCFSGYNVLSISVGKHKVEFNEEDVMAMASKKW